MSKKINLFYYNDNFGDELSSYIVRMLTGKEVRFCYPFSIKRILRNYFAFFHLLLIGKKPLWKLLTAYSLKPVLIAVGSLLESANKHCVVWGTGMAQPSVPIKPRQVIMTRGLLSQEVVKIRGGKILSKECGDPALLMPLLFNPQVEKKYDITIIPHRAHYKEMKRDVELSKQNVHIINLTTGSDVEIENVVKEMKQSRLILSSSLHGLIVAHAYGIPALWVHFEDMAGGDFKFRDYFSSVDIPFYSPLEWKHIDIQKIATHLDDYSNSLLVKTDRLQKIQRALLRNFPYPKVGIGDL